MTEIEMKLLLTRYNKLSEERAEAAYMWSHAGESVCYQSKWSMCMDEMEKMMNDLRNDGKEFNSMQEKFDTTTAMGRFVMDIMQRIAQLESEQIGERVKVGMTQKASFGTGPMGSGHPYGYVYCKGNLEVIEDEAYTVSAIYRLYNEGCSMEDIANSLNRSKIPAKKGGQWNRQSICNILHNPIDRKSTRLNSSHL